MKTKPDTLAHLVKFSAQTYTDVPAIIAPNSLPLIYKNLLTLIEQIHDYLNARGLGASSRIASVLPNTPEAATAFLAISASCTFAPLNPAYKADEFEFYISSLNVAALITLQGFESPIRQVAQKLQIPLIELVPEPEKGAGYFSLIGETGLTANSTDYANAEDILMLLHTSGSTSAPKIVPIQQKALCLFFNAGGRRRNISSLDRCLNVLPLFHLQGLLSVVYPLIFGGSCIYASPFEPKHFIEWLDKYDPTFYSATPTMHQAILEQALRTENFRKNPSLHFLSSSSAALPPTQIKALEATFEVPLIEVYATTETLTISANPLPPKVRKPGSSGIASDTEITIIDNVCQSLPARSIGEIVVQSPWLMSGYINNVQANDSAFCAKGFRTGDLGYLDEEGYLFITGRVKEIINRGGEKITPYEVDQVLLAHSAVKEAVSFPVPHPTLGENIAAVVVLNNNAQVESEMLRQFARQKLAEFKVPYRIVISDHLPKGATGKLQRHKMAAYFAEQLAIQQSKFNQVHVADNLSLTPLQENLLRIWQEVLNIKQIGIHDNFFELGGHSLLAIVLCTKIEAKIGKPIPIELIFKFPTIYMLSGALENHTNIKSKNFNSAITPFQIEGTQPPFFWLFGSKAVPTLLEHMGSNQPLYLLNHQSQDGKRAKHLTISEMASYYLQTIQQIDSEGPYYLGGFSIGGMIIYEIARQLCEQGKKVAVLLLLDPVSISNDKKKPALLKQNLNPHSEYNKFKEIGYITYFLYKTSPIRTKLQKQFEHIIIQTHFSLGKALPVQLNWPYLISIYTQARLKYEPEQVPEGIEKRIIVYVNHREIEDWVNIFNGKIDAYTIDCSHLQLIETPHIFSWIKILKQEIDNQ
jgi:acyl-CoA synthetase (AMP-forming)/AMP-acid ligase II/thioesterase domain-containing protein/acyl carrier protein